MAWHWDRMGAPGCTRTGGPSTTSHGPRASGLLPAQRALHRAEAWELIPGGLCHRQEAPTMRGHRAKAVPAGNEPSTLLAKVPASAPSTSSLSGSTG